MGLQEAGDSEQETGNGGCGKPVALTGEDLGPVRYVQSGELSRERLRVSGRDDRILCAVHDEGGREVFCRLRGVRLDEAAGDLDDGADSVACGQIPMRGELGCEAQRQIGAQGDAREHDTFGVNAWTRGHKADGLIDGSDPFWGMDAVGNRCQIGADGTGAVKVVRRIQGDSRFVEVGREPGGPKIEVAP